MAKFNIKTVKPKFVVTTAPETKINVSINRPIITAKNQKAYFKLKNTGGPKGEKGDTGVAATITVGSTSTGAPGTSASVTNTGSASAAVLDFVIPKGDKGDTGDTGATGSPGEAATVTVGTTTTGNPGTNASVTNSGTQSAAVLNFTIPRGAKGDAGDSSTITVGTTTTGQPGTNASVTNSGTQSAAVLNFTIPRGDKGDQGDPGTPGSPGAAATIAVGTTTTGDPGTNASVTNSGTSSATVLNFTIPRGADGQDGQNGRDGSDGKDGKDGLAATVSVGTVTTGQAGTSASITNSGTSSAAVFDFTIPRGDTGATGADGYSPTASVSKSGDTATITITDKNGTTTASVTEPTKTSDLANDGSDNTSVYVEADELATVATSGSYNDLTDKPTIPTVNNATLTIQKNGTTVNTFTANASSNAIANITVPTSTSDLTNDGADGTSTYVEADDLASVATSGSYNDLTNKPTIPAAQVNSDWDATSGVAQILNKPTLATVATSGLYSDLTGTPNIPVVNNATLTIQRNGTSVGTFTANASSNVTANISVPTKTSDLTNDGSDNTAQYLETDETAYKTASIPYGECDSTSTATVFTATVPGITELRDGVCMLLKNGVVTSASGFTIDINGLGAKPAYSNMAAASRETTLWNINYTMLFVYDSTRVEGGCWILYRGYNSDNNTIGYQLRTNSSTLPAKETGYRYRLWLTSADGQNYVPINTSSNTSTTGTKALNTTTPIDPFGTIVYNSTNGTVNANANLPTGTQWTQYVLDMRYAKYPLTLTFPDPVYLQCTPQASGNGALINDIVQALPTTEDGKIYIYLGNAYSATNMELKQDHPVYYFKDGQIRLWSGETVPTLYTTTGQNTDGAVTQKLFSDTVGNVETILQTLNNGGGAR